VEGDALDALPVLDEVEVFGGRPVDVLRVVLFTYRRRGVGVWPRGDGKRAVRVAVDGGPHHLGAGMRGQVKACVVFARVWLRRTYLARAALVEVEVDVGLIAPELIQRRVVAVSDHGARHDAVDPGHGRLAGRP